MVKLNKYKDRVVKERKKKQNLAFTLAETLITLGIIGVVAVLTIPIVANYSREIQYTTMAKKSYSTLLNALNMIKSNNQGSIDLSSNSSLRQEFSQVMDFVNQSTTDSIYPFNYKYKGYGGTPTNTYVHTQPLAWAQLKDGAFIGFITPSNASNTAAVATIIYDTNGASLPNQFGQDLIVYWLGNSNNNYMIHPSGDNGKGNISGNQVCPACFDYCGVGFYWGCSALRIFDSSKLP